MNIGIKTTAPKRAIWIYALDFWLVRLNFNLIGSRRLCATKKVLSPGSVQKVRIKWSRSSRRFRCGWYVRWSCVCWLVIGWSGLKFIGWLFGLRIDFCADKCTSILIVRILRTHTLSCKQMDLPWCPHRHFRGFCWCYSCRSYYRFGSRWWHKNAIWPCTRLNQFWSVAVNDFKIYLNVLTSVTIVAKSKIFRKMKSIPVHMGNTFEPSAWPSLY